MGQPTTKIKKAFDRSRSRKMHMSLNVAGCLRNHAHNRKLTYITMNGKDLTDRQAKIELTKLMAKGIRVIDCSGECCRFDDQKGCPGHITALKPNDEKAAEIEIEWQEYLKTKSH